MDEIDTFWNELFGTACSKMERRMLAGIMQTITPGDPQFVMPAMLARSLFVTMSKAERGVLSFGPAMSAQLDNLNSGMKSLAVSMAALRKETDALRSTTIQFLAELNHHSSSVIPRLFKKTIARLDDDLRTQIIRAAAISLSFIAGVTMMVVFSSGSIPQTPAPETVSAFGFNHHGEVAPRAGPAKRVHAHTRHSGRD